jgi:hypothetical protein
MWQEYQTWFKEKHGDDEVHLPRTAVFEILRHVTNGQKRALSAVNYLLGSLIYDNFIVVERIISLYTSATEEQRKLRLHAALASNFLKNVYTKHIVLDDNDGKVCTHGLEYALQRRTADGGAEKTTMDCNACKFVPFFFEELRVAVRNASITYGDDLGTPHAITAIDRCERLTSIWRGQCARVANQRLAIAEIHERIEKDCLELKLEQPREAVIVMDYKMKYVSQYYRQKSIEHFAKRGISWHGFLVIFYTYDVASGKVEREHVYGDQIVRGTNKQDGHAVAALLEVFLFQLVSSRVFQNLEHVTIQSDNANYYHSNNLILALPFIGLSVGISIDRYIHTETCDGKGLIDAHFAMGMRHVDRYIGEGNNATSPGEVFDGLVSASGVPNTLTQLVEIDRAMLLQREEVNSSVLMGLKQISRQNEIVFDLVPSGDNCHFNRAEPFSWPGIIRFKTWQFSKIGEPVIFSVDVRKGDVKLQSGYLQDLGASTALEVDDDEEDSQQPTSSVSSATAFGGTRVRYKRVGVLRHERRRLLAAEEQRDSNLGGTAMVSHQAHVDGGVASLLELAASGEVDAGSVEDNEDDSDDDEEHADELEMLVEEGQRRDLLAFAVRCTKDLINDPNAALLVRDGSSDQVEYELAADFDASNKLTRRGFGRRPRHGTQMGRSQAGPYRASIAEAFQNEGSDKMHPSWMLEKLKEMECNKYRLDLPTESDVRKELQRCIRWKKEAARSGGPAPNYADKMKGVVDPLDADYSQFIDSEIEGNPELRPPDFLRRAIEHFSTLPNPLSDRDMQARVKSTFSSRKGAYKKSMGLVRSSRTASNC